MKEKSIITLAILLAAVALSQTATAQETFWDWNDPAAGVMGWSRDDGGTLSRHNNGYITMGGAFPNPLVLSRAGHGFTATAPERLTIDLQVGKLGFLSSIAVEIWGKNFHHYFDGPRVPGVILGGGWVRYTLEYLGDAGGTHIPRMNLTIHYTGSPLTIRIDDFGDIAMQKPAEAGTGFTWQGKLNDNGNPADAQYDFEFKLFDPLSRVHVGPTVTHEDLVVSKGYFSVKLDFGDVFNDRPRLLDIAVRPGASTGTYTSILPRQEITPAPHALYAQKGPYTGVSPVYVDEDFKIGLNPATSAKSLLTSSGNNWIARSWGELNITNMQPYLGIYHCIALTGIFPSRNSAEPFIGEIMTVGFGFNPRGWAFCDGQLLPIAQNQALFSLLGTTYGGDGRTTFALPDLRGRVAVHPGQGPGFSTRRWGERGGTEKVSP